jgi:predicted amidohydrolase YtcJ
MTDLLVRDCTLDNRRVDVRVKSGLVVEVGPSLRRDGEALLEAGGGAVLPGLHDHHLHLHATAAALASVTCGPPEVLRRADLTSVLRQAARTGVVRGVGYHESVAGALDRQVLDEIVYDVPVRVQHRSGAGWFLNSAAIAAIGLDGVRDGAVERDDEDRPTGRLWRGDHLLRSLDAAWPDLAPVGHQLAQAGVTGITDATPGLSSAALTDLRDATRDGRVPQRLLLLGAPLDDPGDDVGPWKVVLDEFTGLELDALVDVVETCSNAGRSVAIHAVTRAEAVVAVTALRAAHARGARIEHGGVLPPDLDDDLRELAVAIVTQPHFVADRGETYLREVDPADLAHLYRCATLLEAGVAVAAGSDAPYGKADPWHAVAAAVSRTTSTGQTVGAQERLTAMRALQLFLGDAMLPGGPPRQVTPSQPADLCLLDCPLDVALAEPSRDHVRATVVAGQVVFDRRDSR